MLVLFRALLAALSLTLLGALPGLAAPSLPVPPPAADQLVASKLATMDDPRSPVIGNAKGAVTIIKFFDYTCPYCKALEPRLQALLRTDKGVRLVVKEFPILTPQSLLATKVALASVRQGKYARYHQALMNYEGRLDEAVIYDTAKSVGLDMARLKKDMTDPAIAEQIIANFNLARALRLFQTPAFIVNGHILTGQSSDIDFPKEVANARKR